MKRTIIITGLVAGLILIAMFVFNKLVSKKGNEPLYAQAVRGPF